MEADKYIRVSVTDTGEGMDEETPRKATEPFFTTKGVGKGTGLGLSMVHGFAEQSGGRLILLTLHPCFYTANSEHNEFEDGTTYTDAAAELNNLTRRLYTRATTTETP